MTLCRVVFGKLINAGAILVNALVTAVTHLDTDVFEIACADAITV